MKRLWRRFLALSHLSDKAVCEESAGLGTFDYHDYSDSTTPYPHHFFVHTCERCGKKFIL